MGRWLLQTFPAGVLVAIFVGGSVVVGLGGFALYRRRGLRAPDTLGDTMVSSFAGRAETLLGILLVFVIVSLYGSFTQAQDAVDAEATGLSQLVRDARALGPPVQGPLEAAVTAYVGEVRGHEWPDMADGHGNPRARVLLDRLYAIVAAHRPAGGHDRVFYEDAVSHLDAVASARRSRLEHAHGSIPTALWVLLLVGAAAGVLTMYPFAAAAADRLQGWLIGVSVALIGCGLVVALMLDYPFSGSLAVSSAALVSVG